MCFRSSSKPYVRKEQYGFKVFKVGKNGHPKGEYASKAKSRSLSKWLDEANFRPNLEEAYEMGGSPEFGWRVFLDKDSASLWAEISMEHEGRENLKVFKVMFKQILAKGYCNQYRAILAKEIFIPKEQ